MPSTAVYASQNGTRIDDESLRALAEDAGIDPAGPTILYCGGGVSASAVLVALTDIGYRGLRVYDGSWSEWSADPLNPTERHERELW